MAKDALFAVGFNLTRQTSTADVCDLIAKLRPVDCGKDLIRVGARNDGGYLIPDDLEGIEYCFSPGVSTIVDFETHLATKGIRCFLADYSVDSPPIQRPEFTFDKKFVGASDSENFFTLSSWKTKYLNGYAGDLLLQADIEGFEYEMLLGAPADVLSSFRVMVIEFHELDRLFDPFVHTVYKACFDKVLRSFYVAHIHPNNCCGSVKKGQVEIPRAMEFTFYNKTRVRGITYQQKFPHPLDRDNIPGSKPLLLPKCWYNCMGSVLFE